MKDIEKDIKKYVDDEVKRAQKQPDFPVKSLLDDVYQEEEKFYVRAPNYEDSVFVSEKMIQWLI